MTSTRWWPYALVLGAAVLCYAALGAVLREVPSYVSNTLGGGSIEIGLAVGTPALTGALLRPLGGRWADRFGSRPMVITGALLMAVGVAPALVTSTVALVASRLVVGAGEALMMSASVLWLLRIAGPERQGRSLGHIGLANYGGLTLGPLIGEALSASHHVGRLWLAAAALPLLGAVASLLVTAPPAEEAANEAPPSMLAMVRRTGRLGIGLMLVNVGYVAVLSFGAIVVTRHGLSIAGLIVPVFGAGVIVSRVVLGSLPDRYGAPIVLAVSVGLEAVGLAVFSAATAPGLAVAALVVLSVGQGLAVPSLGVLAIAGVPVARQGAAAGAFFAYFDAGVGLGGPAVGLVARATSSVGSLVAAAVAVAATAPIVLVRRRGSPYAD